MTRTNSSPPSVLAAAITAAVALVATLYATSRPLGGGVAGLGVGAVPAFIAGMSALKLGLAGGRYFYAAIVLAVVLVLLALA